MAEFKQKSFLHELFDTKLMYTLPDEEINDIKDSVDEMIKNIANKLGEDETFEISHKYLAGSMAEETSIKIPDEFDYLLVLKHLSEPGAIEIHKQSVEDASCYTDVELNECIVHLGYGSTNNHAHIKPGNSKVASLFSSCLEDGYIGNVKLNLKFNDCVIAIIDNQNEHIAPVTRRTGTLSITSPDKSSEGSASTFWLRWKPSSDKSTDLTISIDLVPAIEIQGIEPASLDPDLEIYNSRIVEHKKISHSSR